MEIILNFKNLFLFLVIEVTLNLNLTNLLFTREDFQLKL